MSPRSSRSPICGSRNTRASAFRGACLDLQQTLRPTGAPTTFLGLTSLLLPFQPPAATCYAPSAFSHQILARMSSAAAARMPSKSEVQSLVMRIQAGNTLLVRNLQAICQINGLSRSGVKADLQRRIIHCEFCPALLWPLLRRLKASLPSYSLPQAPIPPLPSAVSLVSSTLLP